jgi:hypothetical protein
MEISEAFQQVHYDLINKDMALLPKLKALQASDVQYLHERYEAKSKHAQSHFSQFMEHYSSQVAHNHRLLDAAIENNNPVESGVTAWMLADSEYQLRAMWQILKFIERPD